MDTYSCPRCKQEITAEEQDVDAAQECRSCGEMLNTNDKHLMRNKKRICDYQSGLPTIATNAVTAQVSAWSAKRPTGNSRPNRLHLHNDYGKTG